MSNKKQDLIIYRNRVWKGFQKWCQKPIYCPALKCKVFATSKGWRHISGLEKERLFSDIYRRLHLLRYAQKIIASATYVKDISYRYGRKYYILETTIIISEQAMLKRKVRVIIEEQHNGRKIFLSVMDKRKRIQKNPS